MNIDILLKNLDKAFNAIKDVDIEELNEETIYIVEHKEHFIDALDDLGRHIDMQLDIEIHPLEDFTYNIEASYFPSEQIIFNRCGIGLNNLISCLKSLIEYNKYEDVPWVSFDKIYKIFSEL